VRRAALFLVVAAAAAALLLGDGRGDEPDPRPPGREPAWAALDPHARCESARQLVTHRDEWPTECRWRRPEERLQGQAFPPPVGPAPFDSPRVEIYVDAAQSREELARAIAHELGHMHHTREPSFTASDWLAARGLPATTPVEVWVEDYAEVFAALFGPPSDSWRAPTPRPTPEALAALKARFFS
jgi:hypothetical protein